jgi:hypothetical protein
MARLESGWWPDTPTSDSLIRAFVFNQCELNGLLAEACDGRVEVTDALHLADTGSAVAFLNQAIMRRPLFSVDDPLLDEVATFFAHRTTPSTLLSVWPTPDLSARGWTLWGHPMICVLAPTAAPYEQPTDVEVTVASTPAELVTAERILIDGFALDAAAGAPAGSILAPGLLETAVSIRLGLLSGEPVATATRYEAYGVNNLTMGATLAAARRRGVWRALVWNRVRESPDVPAVTYTSDDSRPGFIAMGFLPVQRLTLWGVT